jgi:hypothetical protein
MKRWIGLRGLLVLATAVLAAGLVGAVASAKSAAAPANTAAPQISGTAREGSTLTATNGTWSGAPTTYTYQWQRCATDGTACGDITGATKESYTLVTGDVSHTVRVQVTAQNADGKATANSNESDVVDAKNGPQNTVKPAISGSATVGEELRVSNGTWTPTPSSFTRQWQRCDTAGANCVNVAGATGPTYGVRTADSGHRLRALVTAHSTGGNSTTASNPTGVVGGGTTTTTTTTTTTVRGNHAPTIAFLSLRRIGVRVYARFRVCDDGLGRITITERDSKARALSASRHFTVVRTTSCGTFSRNWIPASRFRTKGRYVVTLRASDTSRGLSRLVSRSLVR